MQDHRADVQHQHQQQRHAGQHVYAGIEGDTRRVGFKWRNEGQVKDIDRSIHHQHARRQHHGQHQVHGLMHQQRHVFLQRALDGKIQAMAEGAVHPQGKNRNIEGGQRHIEKCDPCLYRRRHAEDGHGKTGQQRPHNDDGRNPMQQFLAR